MLLKKNRADDIRSVLRYDDTASLTRRRKMTLLSAIGLLDFAVITLYQSGVIRHLPDLRHHLFDSDQVNASKKAYQTGVPDGATGVLLYSANMILATAGGDTTSGRSRWFSVLQGAVVAGGAVGAVNYLMDMVFKQKKICLYCVTGAVINLSLIPLALKEVLGEWRAR